jgi:hypothetical protein
VTTSCRTGCRGGAGFLHHVFDCGALHARSPHFCISRGGSSLRSLQFMSQARAILSLVSTGLGIGIVPEERRNACFDNVVFRPIRVGSAVKTKFHAIWRSDNRNSALLQLRGPRAFDRISGLAIETRLFVVPATNSTCEAPIVVLPRSFARMCAPACLHASAAWRSIIKLEG